MIKIYEVYFADLNDSSDTFWLKEENAIERIKEILNDEECPSKDVQYIEWDLEDTKNIDCIEINTTIFKNKYEKI